MMVYKKMRSFKVHNLWPIPVYQGNIPVKKEWKEKILNLEYERTHIKNRYISKDRYILDSMTDLKQEIDDCCENFIRRYLSMKDKINFYMLNSWSNRHRPKDASQIHYHANSLISGVYYPIFPKKSGDLVMHKNHHHVTIFHNSMRFEYDVNDNVTAEQYQLTIEEGDVVLFPSHLEHSVRENITNLDRYSVAFNYFAKGILGKEEYQLKI